MTSQNQKNIDCGAPQSVWYTETHGQTPETVNGKVMYSLNVGTPSEFVLKGVCYSPCPINGSNGSAPALGDWFWDSYSGNISGSNFSVTGWHALWDRDLPNIRALGANCIRVYSMLSRQLNVDGSYPSPWNSGHLFTHTEFLDKCWNNGVNPLFVMVGIPMPQAMYWKIDYNNTSKKEKEFWENTLKETVTQLADHPAVMGFIIQNELDSDNQLYGTDASFWWGQVQKFSKDAKTIAPTKLVGMAVHDDPNYATHCQQYMAECTEIDFWGVNSYQTQTLQSVLSKSGNNTGYNSLTGDALKAVIFTEYGMPATTRIDADNPLTIETTNASEKAAASTIGSVIPQMFGAAPPKPLPSYNAGLSSGLFYFEYCDERWNQNRFSTSLGTYPPNIYTWCGGPPAQGFPNGYWDNEGFGIYASQRGIITHGPDKGKHLPNNAPIWNSKTNAPALPIDEEVVRSSIANTLKNIFEEY